MYDIMFHVDVYTVNFIWVNHVYSQVYEMLPCTKPLHYKIIQ